MPNKREKPVAVAGEAIGRVVSVSPPNVSFANHPAPGVPLEDISIEHRGPMQEIPPPAVGPNPTGHTDQALFAHGPMLTGEKKTRGDEGKER